MGLHRVENASHTGPAVSLHLYSPPFKTCQSFDQRTGKARTVRMTFWSENGRRTDRGSIDAQQRRNQVRHTVDKPAADLEFRKGRGVEGVPGCPISVSGNPRAYSFCRHCAILWPKSRHCLLSSENKRSKNVRNLLEYI